MLLQVVMENLCFDRITLFEIYLVLYKFNRFNRYYPNLTEVEKNTKNIHFINALSYSLSQGLRSWGQFRKNMSFMTKKSKTNIFYVFWSFPVLSHAERS